VAPLLASREPLVRLAALRVLLHSDPSPEYHQLLRRLFSDSLFSIRWLAVKALARGEEHPGLAAVLRESRPRVTGTVYAYQVDTWLDSVAAIGTGAIPLLPTLLESLKSARSTPDDSLSMWRNTIARLEQLVQHLQDLESVP
jgi:hypothetical protein